MDALIQAEKISRIVSKGRNRKYYRFRRAPFYGGIATADCVGCCLSCIFCWSWNIVIHPERTGKFYSPEFVAEKLIKIARKNKYHRMRVSGNEPTLNREHLIDLLIAIPSHFHFILETNGILLGHDLSYCRELSHFPNLHVRVSLKGCNKDEFESLTGMDVCGSDLQIKALENLAAEEISCHPAVMINFSTSESVNKLRDRLAEIDPDFRLFEIEQLMFYPQVEVRLRKFRFMSDS